MMIDVVKMAAALNPRWLSCREEHDA
jgi:hypothetical protein